MQALSPEWAAWLERLGLPAGLLLIAGYSAWSVAQWAAPRIDRLIERHISLLDKLQETQDRILDRLDEMERGRTDRLRMVIREEVERVCADEHA